jgi:hypothetical protein
VVDFVRFACDRAVLFTRTCGFADTRRIKALDDTVLRPMDLSEIRGSLRLDQLHAIAFVVRGLDGR